MLHCKGKLRLQLKLRLLINEGHRKWEREVEEKVRVTQCEDSTPSAGFGNGKERSWCSKEGRQSQEAGERQERDSSLELPEGMQSCQRLGFSPMKPISNFGPP